ncbi:MAG: S-methyl-5-thioribose-1-phosphate isomerase [Chloroherpetonaceae bacterium]|nr:S-methyl-5-thioribose-1-phosphate isomerase [Chthonomonadaceae bacterium]MDW8208074.1 S-methyl-5-thioribose-1-phosphate isomerase [Chloroherpetonaceae bacterium]
MPIGTQNKPLQTVMWEAGKVRLIDQTALPEKLQYVEYTDWRDVAEAIRTMVVRGAPAIGCAAALGLALGARGIIADGRESFLRRVTGIADTFRAARPTAVNLFWAIDRVLAAAAETEGNPVDLKDAMLVEALLMLDEDIETNRRLGQYGAALLPDPVNVLTHCNAGALATVGYGTALGVVRAAVEAGKKVHVYADETRPRLQGMKLTAWELARDQIPVTVIADSMAASLMRQGKIDCVIVGADRIAANGDTANKIGTYGLAVLAQHHNIPFYVAAPLSTIDTKLASGLQIPIEQRDTVEMTHIEGIRIAPEGVDVINPAFDVTPGELITGFITEKGVLQPPFGSEASVPALPSEGQEETEAKETVTA